MGWVPRMSTGSSPDRICGYMKGRVIDLGGIASALHWPCSAANNMRRTDGHGQSGWGPLA